MRALFRLLRIDGVVQVQGGELDCLDSASVQVISPTSPP